MRFTLSFHARGDRYRPSRIPYAFASQYDVGSLATRGAFKGSSYPYGASAIEVPDDLPWVEKIPALVATVVPLMPGELKGTGQIR